MGKKNKLTIDFKGYDTLKKQLDDIGGNATERAVESSLKASQQFIASQASETMEPHNKSGRTKKSIVKDGRVIWTGSVAEIDVGFDIEKGGLASVFLMYGTKVYGQPHVTPDRNLFNAVYGSKTRKKIRELQEKAFQKVIKRVAK